MTDAPVVIVNPAAGGGRAARAVPWLRERLERRPDARLEVTRGAGDAERIASDAADRGHARVIAVGGDGTVQEVVNGLLEWGGASTTVGIVPLGSGNDLARSLGLPDELGTAWRSAVGNTTRPIDVALARNGGGNERWFASAGGVGFDAQVAAAMAKRRGWQGGRAGYLVTTLRELRRFKNGRVRITMDGKESLAGDVLFVAIANGEYYGGGMRIAPGAVPDDGLLDLCVVGDISRLTALREMRNLYRGTHVANPAVSMHRAAEISISGDGAIPIHLDGEPFGTLPLTVSVRARALGVAVP